MTAVKTQGTVLKTFQTDAVDNATAILSRCLRELAKVRSSASYEKSRRIIVGDLGAVLFEAPTGTGKTLMAGNVAENLSLLNGRVDAPPVLWFWFAPFAGLVEQASRVIRTEFPALRPKNLTIDRNPDDLRSGDVYVTTWASVAVANEASRKARSGTEELPSIDVLVGYARARGFTIGAVVDESHHSFRGQSQAFAFYRDVLQPDVTLLATATPRDKDVELFCKEAGITNLRRITVSRQQAVDDRLIKEGVKVAVFKAPADVADLIDFKRTALRQGVAVHRKLKELLKQIGSTVTPLLLVQVESENDKVAESSVAQVTGWLKELGFRSEGDSEVIRSHTAKEPDPYFGAIAADETVEVLIFKMAAAIGFDAPRAFTLVSFRPSRDEDFGVQIVGRILRVDRRLQCVPDVPAALNYGYVFLSDNAGQPGLMSAAGRINAVRDELASVASNVMVVALGGDAPAAQMNKDGQIHIFPIENEQQIEKMQQPELPQGEEGSSTTATLRAAAATAGGLIQQTLIQAWELEPEPAKPYEPYVSKTQKLREKGYFSYPLRTDLGAPTHFSRAVFSPDGEDILRGITARFRFDDDALLVAQQSAAKIIMEEIEIFANRRDRPEEIRAVLAQKEIDAKAQSNLLIADEYEAVDAKALHRALQEQLRKELEQRGIDHLFDTPEKLRSGLHKILALRPEQLKKAISETIARHITADPTDEALPAQQSSLIQLDTARLNVYGVFPEDLNTWERPFAEVLDNDLTGTVLWWHRNPVRKLWSVSMPLPGQNDFYPDFVVGVKGRARSHGILLVETKREINDEKRNALVKAQASHPEYGKVMMLYWEDVREWRVVEYDPIADKNFLDRALRAELLAMY